jgi:hypothetical protein
MVSIVRMIAAKTSLKVLVLIPAIDRDLEWESRIITEDVEPPMLGHGRSWMSKVSSSPGSVVGMEGREG